MNRVWKVASAVILLSGGIWAGSVLSLRVDGATASQPGTTDDPIVTKSYVDQQIQQALKGGGGTTTTPDTSTTPPVAGSTSSDDVEIVTVKPGQTLMAKAGAEFVVRSGKAVVYSSDANGVADLTSGTNISNGKAADTNHLLSFPRDGRGIQVQEGNKYSLIVMVRGGYELK